MQLRTKEFGWSVDRWWSGTNNVQVTRTKSSFDDSMVTTMPDAGVVATILLIVGLFLLALELMIPSFGMIGILSAIALLVSAWSAWQAWWGTSPGFFWTYAAFWLLGIPSVLGGALFLLQNTSLGDRLVLRGPAAESKTPSVQEQNRLEALVGRVGEAQSLLTPGGMVTVDYERYHAESPGMMIESGTPIEVVGVKGNRLVVKVHDPNRVARKPATEKHSEADPLADTIAAVDITDAMKDVDGDNSASLDFEIPED